jgi:hypothetical protein
MTPGGTQFVDDVVSPVSLCPVPKECGDAAVRTLRIRSKPLKRLGAAPWVPMEHPHG